MVYDDVREETFEMKEEEEEGEEERYQLLRPTRYNGSKSQVGEEEEEVVASFKQDSLSRISQVASMINRMDFTLGSQQSQPLPIFSSAYSGSSSNACPGLPGGREEEDDEEGDDAALSRARRLLAAAKTSMPGLFGGSEASAAGRSSLHDMTEEEEEDFLSRIRQTARSILNVQDPLEETEDFSETSALRQSQTATSPARTEVRENGKARAREQEESRDDDEEQEEEKEQEKEEAASRRPTEEIGIQADVEREIEGNAGKKVQQESSNEQPQEAVYVNVSELRLRNMKTGEEDEEEEEEEEEGVVSCRYYLKLELAGSKARTATQQERGGEVSWSEEFQFHLPGGTSKFALQGRLVRVKEYGSRSYPVEALLGSCSLPLPPLAHAGGGGRGEEKRAARGGRGDGQSPLPMAAAWRERERQGGGGEAEGGGEEQERMGSDQRGGRKAAAGLEVLPGAEDAAQAEGDGEAAGEEQGDWGDDLGCAQPAQEATGRGSIDPRRRSASKAGARGNAKIHHER
eukprot:750072-Hanusia_phi.AAC.6